MEPPVKEAIELARAIDALEGQRLSLGDRVVDAAQSILRQQLAEQEAHFEDDRQRRLVSLLFVDVVNSVLLSQGLEPEEVREVIGGVLGKLARPVEAHGGQVIQYVGDGFVAVFGLARTHENDARQGVRAGLAILNEARLCAADLERSYRIVGFNVRLGMHTGRVVAGRFSAGESPVMGLTVSLASRMEEAAVPGTLLISQFSYQHVRGAFEVQLLEPVNAKGFPHPITAYQVLSALPRTFRTFTRGVEGVETALIGRQPELKRLKSILRQALRKRQSKVVTIVGDAGVGKSRLLYEFDRWLAASGFSLALFKARPSPQMTAMPFGVLRELVSYRLGLRPTDSLELTRQKLEEGLTPYLDDEAEMKAHFIGSLLGFDFSGSPHLKGVADDPRQLDTRARFYLTQCLSALAAQVPSVVMLDDLQWADAPSVGFIAQLLHDCPGLPLMIICLGRTNLSERFPGWGERAPRDEEIHDGGTLPPTACHVHLGPLTRTDSQELLSAILRHVDDLPASLCEKILDRAEGNPFYLEEFVQSLLDAGVIVRQAGGRHWKLDLARLGSLELPDTLVALVEARLDGLEPAERTLVLQASVIGKVFWHSALQAIRGGKEVAQSELDALSKHGFIYPQEVSTFEGTQEYSFHHALLRDVAYQALVKADRQACHARVADWLVEATDAGGRAGEFAPLIAGHYETASMQESAADWYIQAGRRAWNQGNSSQASVFYDSAMQLLPQQPIQSADRQFLLRRWQLLIGRDDVLGVLGETEKRIEVDIALVELAQQLKDDPLLAEAYFRRGFYLGMSGDHPREQAAYTLGLASARRAGDRDHELLILGLKSLCDERLGQLDLAARTAADALACSRLVTDDLVKARCLTNISTYYTETGDLARAARLDEQQLVYFQRTGNIQDEVVCLSNLGYNYIQLGLPAKGIATLENCIARAQAIGHRKICAYGQLNLALAHWRNADTSAVLEQLEGCLPQLQSMNNTFGYAVGTTYASLAYEQIGRLEDALAGFELAAGSLGKISTPGYMHDARAGVARCLLGLGRLDLAWEAALSLWDYMREHAGTGMEFPILAHETCADIFAAVGEPTLARRAIRAAYGELILRAGRISLPEWRQSFLESIPEHRRIQERWQKNKE